MKTNSYVPSARAFRTSGNYIPNQQAGSAPKPANIYEPFTSGTGEQHTGPFVTQGNTQGQLAVNMTAMMDDLKSQIERVTFTTDKYFGTNASTTTTAKISWVSPEVEKKFNQYQKEWEDKVQAIKEANKVSLPIPGANATREEQQKYSDAAHKASLIIGFQTVLLGPSPTQMILSAAKSTKDFKLSTSETVTLPQIQQVKN